jgi:hypothetical protein
MVYIITIQSTIYRLISFILNQALCWLVRHQICQKVLNSILKQEKYGFLLEHESDSSNIRRGLSYYSSEYCGK